MRKIAIIILTAVVACMTIEAKKMSDLTIVIDPGHGGYDGDDRGLDIFPYCAVVEEGYWESKSNLVKGLHLQNILDSLGVDIHLTRVHNIYNEIDGDDIPDEPGLATRAYVANNLGADAFISIHSNAGEGVNYPLMIYHAGGKYDDWSGALTTYKEENKILSEVINDVFNTSVYSNWVNYKGQINTEAPGRVTSDVALLGYSLGVLRNLHGVGMLSEGGMHEHRPQAHRLMNNDYNWLEAWYFAKALMIYFDTEDRFVTGNVAGVIYDDHNLRELVYTGKYANLTMLGRDKFLPLNGANVELLDASGKVVQERITDNDYNGVFVFRNIAPGTYTVRASKDGYYLLEKTVNVVADEVVYQDMPLSMKREFPLEVTSYLPNVEEGELVSCGERLVFEFNTDIDVEEFEKAFSIVPAVDGYFKYENSYRKVSFIPTTSFVKSTDYVVTISKTACTPDTIYENNSLAEDFVLKFTTMPREHLELIDNFPKDGGSIHYDAAKLEFRFDYKIDGSKDYIGKVTVYDSNDNVIAASARSCSYNKLSNNYGNIIIGLSKDLTIGESYRAVLSGELRDEENLLLGTDYEVNFVAKDEGAEQEGTLLEDFENASIFAYNADETVGISSSSPKYVRSTSTKLFDKSSGCFTYTFDDNREGVIVWDYAGAEPKTVVKGDKLGVYVSGDFNNHELYIGVTSGTDTKYEKICDLNFLGWKYFEVEMNSLEAGYTYNLSDVKLVQVTSAITQTGMFYIDNIIKAGTSGIEDVVAAAKDAVKVYPVPASDVIHVEAPAEIQALELVNIQGTSVAKVYGVNSVDVKEQPQGVYVLKVYTNEGMTSHRVAISK